MPPLGEKVAQIKKTGKHIETIYICHFSPTFNNDYLELISRADIMQGTIVMSKLSNMP